MDEQKLAYQFSEQTGEYIGPRFAQRSSGEWLLPGSSTWDAPPELAEHQLAVWDGQAWELKADYRGIKYWHTQTKEQITIAEIDCYPDELWTDQDPAQVDLNYTKWDGRRWMADPKARERTDICQRMATLDLVISREVEDLYADTGAIPSYPARAAAIQEKKALRTRLAEVAP